MKLSEQLEIFLITYNRQEALTKTLQQLLGKNSPVKDVSIYVLDNHSPDQTRAVAESFAAAHPNVHYLCHKYNVGLGGNLIKAMEMAQKPYFWILCDDDDFDWSAFGEVEQAVLSGRYDIVMTTYTPGFRSEQIPYLINEMCFVPSAIYKTAQLDDTVLTNAYAMAHNLFPFHALSTKIINQQGKIFVPQGRVVLQSTAPKSHQAKRKLREGIYRRLQTFSLLWGYVDSYSLIQDKKLRYACMNVLCLGNSFFSSMRAFISWYPFTWQNLFDIFYYVSWKQKLQILLLLIALPFYYLSPVWFYRTSRGINIRLFWVIKTRIWSVKKK